jgi:PAS domain S-box-containing protein
MIPTPGNDTGRGALDIESLGSRYHAMRAFAGGSIFVAMAVFGLATDWAPAVLSGLLAALVGGHALWNMRRPGSIFGSLLVDTTGVILAFGLLAPPSAVGLPPVLAISTAAILFLDSRRALVVTGYATIGITSALVWARLTGRVEWTALESVVLVAVSVLALLPILWWLLDQAGRSLRHRSALEETLREKESRYQLITENVSDAIVATDHQGIIVYSNPAMERVFGYRPDELIGRDLRMLMPERFRPAHRRGMEMYLETGRRRSDWHAMALTGLHRDGSELSLEVSFGESLGLDGRRFIGTIRDVTDRKQSELALRASEARYRGLFEGVPVGVYRTGLSGEILDANTMLAELLGFDNPSEVVGRPAQSFYVDPTDREVWRHRLEARDVLRGHEIQLVRDDGSTIWVRDSGRELKDEGGTLTGYEGTLEDVTERRHFEEQLRAMVGSQRQRLLFEKALSACSHALLVGSDDGAFEEALEALLEATGVSAVFVERNETHPELGPVTNLIYEATSSRQPTDYDHWTNVPWSDMPVAHSYLSRGEPYAFGIHELEGREREIYEVTTTKSELDIPIFVGDEWWGLIGFADFVKERPWRPDEVNLLRTVAQMIGAFWERQRAHEKLQELVYYKDEFVASVSHELRTPLTAVVGLSEELANVSPESFTPEELAEFHQLLAQQSREVAFIVEDLLVAARVEIETVSIDLQPVDLDAEVAATINGWPSEFGSMEFEPGHVKVQADPTRLRQVTRNLLTNAVRYGGHRVVVVTGTADDWGVVEVRDDGAGVDADDLERIFQPYERASGVEVARPGSVGLGLYVSRQLARLMGGDLTCHRDGGETVFRLTLPVL